MRWSIRPGQFYADLDIARNIRKFFRLVDWTPVTRSWVGLRWNRTGRNNVGWFDQNTSQPTSSQPIRRKRRAGDRIETRSDVGRDVRREGARWGTPRKRTLFGPEGQNGVSSGNDVAELGWPPDDEYPAVAQSGWPHKDEHLEEARSPRVELVDAVARLQKNWRNSGRSSDTAAPEGRRVPPRPRGVGIYVDVGAHVYGEVQLGPISASV